MNMVPETLEAFRDGPSDAAGKAKWVAPIIKEIPTDAWENPLKFSVNGNTYEIRQRRNGRASQHGRRHRA